MKVDSLTGKTAVPKTAHPGSIPGRPVRRRYALAWGKQQCLANIKAILESHHLPGLPYLVPIELNSHQCTFLYSTNWRRIFKLCVDLGEFKEYFGSYREMVPRYALELVFHEEQETVTADIDKWNPCYPGDLRSIKTGFIHLFTEVIPNWFYGTHTNPFEVAKGLKEVRGLNVRLFNRA
jgi:hypothetical protein